MNFLGHLYLSEGNLELMLANLFGDFVKGKDYSYLPPIIQKGVLLHRQIDDFIDRHPLVTDLRLNLYSELPKIAGIAIDLYFDHLLAKNWKHYHPEKLEAFVARFYNYTNDSTNLQFKNYDFTYPSSFIHLLNMMKKYDWLNKYAHLKGLDESSRALSNRIAFTNDLYKATAVYSAHKEEITHAFEVYMEDAKNKFEATI